MPIHHAKIKKAEKLGVELTEDAGQVRAFVPSLALAVFGNSPDDAMAQIQAARALHSEHRVTGDPDDRRLAHISRRDDDFVLVGGPMPPAAAHDLIMRNQAEWAPLGGSEQSILPFDEEQSGEPPADSSMTKTPIERINGIAIDGAVAYKEKTPAGDCPYSSETEDDEEYANFERWNEEWDSAADDHEENGGSVVRDTYRARYAELGHATHCGDWLANVLNNLVLSKKETDIARFETICDANGVSLAKYNRTTPGWQGRLRMTGRNLLAKRVFAADGVLLTPVDGAEPSYKAPADWMAAQRFKANKVAQ